MQNYCNRMLIGYGMRVYNKARFVVSGSFVLYIIKKHCSKVQNCNRRMNDECKCCYSGPAVSAG